MTDIPRKPEKPDFKQISVQLMTMLYDNPHLVDNDNFRYLIEQYLESMYVRGEQAGIYRSMEIISK